ncbi:MAG TPA: tyrosine-type recombinase/integrase [Pseudolysinimonas sp.]|nr:tyrosine-type recombinase/integrase [Pseudolysinimonas sp.]
MGTIHPYETTNGRRYRVAYRKPDRSQGTKRGFRTKKQAELYLATIEVSKSQGDYIDPAAGRVTIDRYGTEWMRGLSHLKPSARRSIDSAWRTWVGPRWGKWPLVSIKHSDVKAWVSDISAERSATTTARAYGVLASILDSAVLDRRIHSNPARGVKLPRKVRARKVYLSHEKVELLAEEAGDFAALVYLLAYTGMRWGEASALRIRDVDLIRRRASIVDNAVAVGGQIVVGSPKTHRVRSVPFPKFVARLLTDQMQDKGPDNLLFGDGERHLALPHSRQGWFAQAVRRVQARDESFPRLTPHELRHTAASLSVAAGANVKAVQRMLGHASAAMTLDIYADLFDDDLDGVADALEAARAKALSGVA